jgi:copper chaperone CopZ
MTTASTTTVLMVSGVHWASSKNVAESILSRRPGVLAVEVNPVAQTATVTYDPAAGAEPLPEIDGLPCSPDQFVAARSPRLPMYR